MLVLWIVLGIVGLFVLTVVALVVYGIKAGPKLMDAQRVFFAETGYDPVDLPKKVSMAGSEEKYVRRLDGDRRIHFHASMQREPGRIVRRQSWWMPVSVPPTTLVQIADRSLSSLGKDVKEALTRSSREWQPIYPGPIATGDGEVDKRFAVFAPSGVDVGRVLATPGLRDLLLACPEVDLVVTAKEIRFSDPKGKNLADARGLKGLTGRITASIPVHRRIHAILEHVERAG